MIGLIETIADGGAPVQARNTLAAVRKMFNWAVSRDLLDRPIYSVRGSLARAAFRR